jgi:hypothetical protein
MTLIPRAVEALRTTMRRGAATSISPQSGVHDRTGQNRLAESGDAALQPLRPERLRLWPGLARPSMAGFQVSTEDWYPWSEVTHQQAMAKR